MTENQQTNANQVVLEMIQPSEFHTIKPNEANRSHQGNISHIRKLKKSMMKHGFDYSKPIVVNNENVIVAGHHRFFAAQEVNKEKHMPIYIVRDGAKSFVDRCNDDDITLKWSTSDYIRLYSKQGLQAYIDLNAIQNGYSHFPIKVIIASAAGIYNQASGEIFEAVRTGSFQFMKNRTRLHVEIEMDEIQNLHDLIKEDYKPKGNRINMHLGLAYLWLKSKPNFNKEAFFKACLKQQDKLVPQTGGTTTNRKLLLDVYNHGKRTNKIEE
jgi:hypothetical protein